MSNDIALTPGANSVFRRHARSEAKGKTKTRCALEASEHLDLGCTLERHYQFAVIRTRGPQLQISSFDSQKRTPIQYHLVAPQIGKRRHDQVRRQVISRYIEKRTMSDGHTGRSLPSIADGSIKTMSASSGLASPDSKRPCGQMALYVGGQGVDSATRKMLLHSQDQDDDEDEDYESDGDSPKRSRRKRASKVHKVKVPEILPQYEMTSFGERVLQ